MIEDLSSLTKLVLELLATLEPNLIHLSLLLLNYFLKLRLGMRVIGLIVSLRRAPSSESSSSEVFFEFTRSWSCSQTRYW